MRCVADFCCVPLGVGASVGREVAAACRYLKEFENGSLKTMTHAYGTNIEGEMSQVLRALEGVHRFLHQEYAVPRISTTVKIGTRIDKDQTMEDKIEAVRSRNGKL